MCVCVGILPLPSQSLKSTIFLTLDNVMKTYSEGGRLIYCDALELHKEEIYLNSMCLHWESGPMKPDYSETVA